MIQMGNGSKYQTLVPAFKKFQAIELQKMNAVREKRQAKDLQKKQKKKSEMKETGTIPTLNTEERLARIRLRTQERL